MVQCKVMRATLPNGEKVMLIVEIVCVRCGRDHTRLFATKFFNPVVIGNEVFSFYSICPITNEPILIGGGEREDFGMAEWKVSDKDGFSLAT